MPTAPAPAYAGQRVRLRESPFSRPAALPGRVGVIISTSTYTPPSAGPLVHVALEDESVLSFLPGEWAPWEGFEVGDLVACDLPGWAGTGRVAPADSPRSTTVPGYVAESALPVLMLTGERAGDIVPLPSSSLVPLPLAD